MPQHNDMKAALTVRVTGSMWHHAMLRLQWLLITAAGCVISGCATQPTLPTTDAIDAYAQRAMAGTGAQGLAIAVINDGEIRHVAAYGRRNAQGAPLTVDTVMYGASLTKAVFAQTVMQLVDQGRVDLDRPIADLLPQPLPDYGENADVVERYADYAPLAEDSRWRAITPRMALDHSTGFANYFFFEDDERARIHFDPGTRYAYSGDGFILLQLGLEAGLGLNVGTLTDTLFERLGMTRTSLVWRDDFASNLADGWAADGSVVPHDERSRVRAAG